MTYTDILTGFDAYNPILLVDNNRYINTLICDPITNSNSADVTIISIMAQVSHRDIAALTNNSQINSGRGGIGIVATKHHYVRPDIADEDDIFHGAIVATFGTHAYADYSRIPMMQCVKISDLHPRNILYPVACGIYLISLHNQIIKQFNAQKKKILIIGCGFIASVIYQMLQYYKIDYTIDVYGFHNQEIWNPYQLKSSLSEKYDIIFDLSDDDRLVQLACYNNDALIITISDKLFAVPSSVIISVVDCDAASDLNMRACMIQANKFITDGIIQVDKFWTHKYNRYNEWQQAFDDMQQRTPDVKRSYIKWDDMNG